MELILDTYQAPVDPAVPLVCFDEAGKELQADIRPGRAVRPGHGGQHDAEYARAGSANLFLWCAPHLGHRQVTVTARRTRHDWARAMRDLVDAPLFADATRIVVVLDNLNTHRLSSLYATFPPAEARRIARKLDLRFTPVHGSWLNIAELELSALGRQCLRRRIPTATALATEVAAWAAARNAAAVPIAWSFTVADARRALPHVYPRLEPDAHPVTDHSG